MVPAENYRAKEKEMKRKKKKTIIYLTLEFVSIAMIQF